MMYKAIDDQKTDIFLSPIPRWITHYGFGATIALLIVLFAAASFVKYPTTISLNVTIRKKSTTAEVDFETYQKLLPSQKIEISTPFVTITGITSKSKSYAINKSIIVPVIIADSTVQKLPFKDKIICEGKIVIENKSLLYRIFR
jgi:hypothetical protein